MTNLYNKLKEQFNDQFKEELKSILKQLFTEDKVILKYLGITGLIIGLLFAYLTDKPITQTTNFNDNYESQIDISSINEN